MATLGAIFATLNRKRNTLKEAFTTVKDLYGLEIAENVEKMFRLESAHFTSSIFRKTNGMGALAFTEVFPYGWGSYGAFWTNNPAIKPIGTTGLLTNGYSYIQFDSVLSAAMFTAEILKHRDNNPGRYFSSIPSQIEDYNSRIAKIKTQYV
jgi:hypothetical protein